MKKFFRLSCVFMSIISILVFSLIIYGNKVLPDQINVISDDIVFLNIFTAKYPENNYIQQVNYNNKTKQKNSYQTQIKLLGSFPVKDINVIKSERKYVVLGGELIGIKLKTDGVLIVGTEKIETVNGFVSPAEECGVKIGDTLKSINGQMIYNNTQLGHIIENSNGEALNLNIIRDGKQIQLTLKPKMSRLSNSYKGGLWIRDSTGGLGTLTFTDFSTGIIASLGHGIYDVDTKKLMPSSSGALYSATLTGITKGKNGTAGELKGAIGNEFLGDILTNSENGIYGYIQYHKNASNAVPVALTSEIKLGPAKIISTINNDTKEYFDIEIEKINNTADNKNMIIKITDKKLIDTTGGIVQGMSGSPIVQNGMFVGAVTHVFLNDPTRGYAIIAENMLLSAQAAIEENANNIKLNNIA